MWLRIIIGIIGVIIGAFLIIKNEWVLANVGKNAWAETHLGAEGGSRLFYKLIGLAIIVVSFLLITGLLANIFDFKIFDPIFRRN